MSMELDIVYAATLASDVYNVKGRATREAFIAGYKKDMELSDQAMVSGKTGGYVIQKKHVMAVFAKGKGDDYKRSAFVLIKGTASGYDALTDLNAGIRGSHTNGFAVHQGFYRAFDSILTDLKKFMSSLAGSGVTTVHCVGHSLGGAIATLAADYIKSRSRDKTVKIYTFGSPRVGHSFFAGHCTSSLKPHNIYRTYHTTDPVPMVPTWPFYHVPNSQADYRIHSPVSLVPWKYHLMEHYIDSAKKAGSWDVARCNRPKSYLDATVERWLKSEDVISFHANTLELYDAALLYVIKKVINAAGIVLISSASGYMTLLDRMAMLLSKAAKVAAKTSIWVYRLVKKMAKLVGLTVKEGASLTVELIRMVFLRLHNKISQMIGEISRRVN